MCLSVWTFSRPYNFNLLGRGVLVIYGFLPNFRPRCIKSMYWLVAVRAYPINWQGWKRMGSIFVQEKKSYKKVGHLNIKKLCHMMKAKKLFLGFFFRWWPDLLWFLSYTRFQYFELKMLLFRLFWHTCLTGYKKALWYLILHFCNCLTNDRHASLLACISHKKFGPFRYF